MEFTEGFKQSNSGSVVAKHSSKTSEIMVVIVRMIPFSWLNRDVRMQPIDSSFVGVN